MLVPRCRTASVATAAAMVIGCLLGLPATNASASGSGAWTAAASMAQPRDFFTATVLSSGKVLVVGGSDRSSPTRSAELYDPVARTWSPTGSLRTARANHTATLLPNGRVLVAGGVNLDGYLSSAELYNPATGKWRSLPSMPTPHFNHTATLLPTGKVLVAGGGGTAVNNSTPQAASAIYDPATKTWASTGSLNTRRERHTATLLGDGTVLAAGGFSGTMTNNWLSSSELYDPARGTWTPGPDMAMTRTDHTATLLRNGQVLVAAGYTSTSGVDAGTASAELYDPASRTWRPTGSLVNARSDHAATILKDGTVLVSGGASSLPTSAEIYDPALGGWRSGGSMTTPRRRPQAALLANGQVLVAGGTVRDSSGQDVATSSAERFTPSP
jgi:N-acetylneuraminic acid mutarotase